MAKVYDMKSCKAATICPNGWMYILVFAYDGASMFENRGHVVENIHYDFAATQFFMIINLISGVEFQTKHV